MKTYCICRNFEPNCFTGSCKYCNFPKQEISNKTVQDVINYIENDAEIAIPISEFFDITGSHITKKEYGKILIKHLVKELRSKFADTTNK